MRKIEQEMINAAKTGRNWENGNTKVVAFADGSANVYLFGNHIGSYYNGRFHPNENTLRRWPTVTTRSRLRAFGVDVWQNKNTVYLNGHEV